MIYEHIYRIYFGDKSSNHLPTQDTLNIILHFTPLAVASFEIFVRMCILVFLIPRMRATRYLHPVQLDCLLFARQQLRSRFPFSIYQGHVFPTLSWLLYPENGARSSETWVTSYFITNRCTKKQDKILNTSPWAEHALRFTSHTDLLNKNLFSFVCCQPMILSSKNSFFWPTDTFSFKIKIPQHTFLLYTAITIIYCEMDYFIM